MGWEWAPVAARGSWAVLGSGEDDGKHKTWWVSDNKGPGVWTQWGWCSDHTRGREREGQVLRGNLNENRGTLWFADSSLESWYITWSLTLRETSGYILLYITLISAWDTDGSSRECISSFLRSRVGSLSIPCRTAMRFWESARKWVNGRTLCSVGVLDVACCAGWNPSRTEAFIPLVVCCVGSWWLITESLQSPASPKDTPSSLGSATSSDC